MLRRHSWSTHGLRSAIAPILRQPDLAAGAGSPLARAGRSTSVPDGQLLQPVVPGRGQLLSTHAEAEEVRPCIAALHPCQQAPPGTVLRQLPADHSSRA
jgi:hypothetical protein